MTNNLDFCKQCENRDFDPKQGVVCALTSAKPTFVEECESYKEDLSVIAQNKRKDQDAIYQAKYGGANSGGVMNAGIWGGILAIVGGIVWLIAGLAANRIFFYPFFLIIGGIISIVRGSAEMNRRKKAIQQPKNNPDLLDDF